MVILECKRVWKRHANQIISCSAPEMPTTILDPFQKVNLSTGHVNLEKNGEIITDGNAGNDTEILNNQNEKSFVKEIVIIQLIKWYVQKTRLLAKVTLLLNIIYDKEN